MADAGIFVVTAVGNSGPACSTASDPPGFYESSFSVGALAAHSDVIAPFSSRGPVTVDGSDRMKPNIVAPGSDIRSAARGGGYKILSGTSMATPQVAGSVALLWSAFPELRRHIAETERILEATALHQTTTLCGEGESTSPNNVYGYGTIDVLKAYELAARLYRHGAVRPS